MVSIEGGKDTCWCKSIGEICCPNHVELDYTFGLMWPTLGVHHNPHKWSCNHHAASIEGGRDTCYYYRTIHKNHSNYHHISIMTLHYLIHSGTLSWPHWGPVHTKSQVSGTTCVSKSQHGGKVPNYEPQVMIKIWLNVVNDESRLFFEKYSRDLS